MKDQPKTLADLVHRPETMTVAERLTIVAQVIASGINPTAKVVAIKGTDKVGVWLGKLPTPGLVRVGVVDLQTCTMQHTAKYEDQLEILT